MLIPFIVMACYQIFKQSFAKFYVSSQKVFSMENSSHKSFFTKGQHILMCIKVWRSFMVSLTMNWILVKSFKAIT